MGLLILALILGFVFFLLCLGRWGVLATYTCFGFLLAGWMWNSWYAHANQGTDGGFALYALCIPWFGIAVARAVMLVIQDTK